MSFEEPTSDTRSPYHNFTDQLPFTTAIGRDTMLQTPDNRLKTPQASGGVVKRRIISQDLELYDLGTWVLFRPPQDAGHVCSHFMFILWWRI